MERKISNRLANLEAYAFAEVDKKVAELKTLGIDAIDFGVGDPSEAAPEIVRAAIKESVDVHARGGYPSYIGSDKFRKSISAWMERRFEIELDPATELCTSIGSKEATFNFPEAFVNPGEIVLVPNPGYPPYTRGTIFADGEVHLMNLLPENNFLPDLDAIPEDVRARAKIIWLNYPNNPTGALAPRSFFEKVVKFGRENEIIVASDEAYTENYFGEKPISILQVAREGVVAFQSLSKRSCMTGYRVGWIAGDAKIVEAFKKLKTNIDSGTPTFIQDAAITALSDEMHVKKLRELYKRKRDIIADAFVGAGLKECRSDATIYIWQRVPEGMTSLAFAEKLLNPKIAVVTTPGNWISEKTPDGNPGEGFVRLALVPSVDDCKSAAGRIGGYLKL